MKAILTINSGSSSLRFAVFEYYGCLAKVLSGKFDRIGLSEAKVWLRDERTGKEEELGVEAADHLVCIRLLVQLLAEKFNGLVIKGIGHRVVHGGGRYRDPQLVDDLMLAELRRITLFAPNHLPQTIALMEDCAVRFPLVPQIACFDTTFHKTLPRVATLLPIPRRYEAWGVQRYGFHGLSYAYLMEKLNQLEPGKINKGRVILAHLGNGASMAAVVDGRCMDTSMSFTPAAGLVMGTRSGDLDPGLAAFLARSEMMSTQQFDHMVHYESGLLGVSEISSDMRDLLPVVDTDVRAAEAVALFCYQAKKWIGSFAAVLGGVDTLVFSGGVGEHNPTIRARICDGLEFLGIMLDAEANATTKAIISEKRSRVLVRVIPTDEEGMIARSAHRVITARADNQEVEP